MQFLRLLIKLMLTLLVLGVFSAIVGPRLFDESGDADRDVAQLQMANLATVVKLWTSRYRRMPARLEQLIETDASTGEAFLDALPPDPWGTPYGYERTGRTQFVILSHGADRTQGTDDDLAWPDAVGEPTR